MNSFQQLDYIYHERSHNLQLTVLYMLLKLPHFAHYNVVPSLTSRVQLCCIQYRMRGYGLVSRANYRLVSHVSALGQSPLQLDQYRSSIKSPVLLYSFLHSYNYYNSLDLQLLQPTQKPTSN